MQYSALIQRIAQENQTNADEVEAEMILAIQAAKDNPNFKLLFGGNEPTPEEFIEKLVYLVSQSDR